jgi:HSP20 family protein
MKYYSSPRREMARRMARHQRFHESHRNMNVHIPVNVESIEDDYVLTAFVPGIAVDHIEIEIIEDQVHISGSFASTEDKSYLLQEIPEGKFKRTLRLPATLNAKTADAEVKDGLLTLRISKAEEAKAKLVKIKAK